VATAVATPISTPITSSGNIFSLLPAKQPAGYVSRIKCPGAIGASDPVAIVQLQAAVMGAGAVVLRDYADPSKPRTACTFGTGIYGQLIDARHLLFLGADRFGAVIDLPEVRYHWFRLPAAGSILAVGPKLDQVLWVTYDPQKTATDTIHLSTSAGDHVIATLPDNNVGRCGSAEDSKSAAYTPSGSHFFVLDQPFPPTTSLIVVEGETSVLSVIPPKRGWPAGGNPAMALWSPTLETLYYRQGHDIWKLRPGSQPEKFLAGVDWLQPTISPDGAHMAYSVLRPNSVLHDVYLIDLAHESAPHKIGAGARKLPVFVNSTQLWFKSEGNDHGCIGGENERPLIYNIVDGSEAPSIISQVMNVWPATSSNF
jgi:hypothetical protein